jgi:YaiO family outer membrane protein
MSRTAVSFAAAAAAVAVAIALGVVATSARAGDSQDDAGISLRLDRSSLELRLAAQQVSAGYGNWREAGITGTYSRGPHVLRGELAALRRFNESGSYVAVMDTVTLDPDWYASVAAGAGDGAFYLPRYRFDAFINRKLLAARNLVFSVGVGYYSSPDGHIDRSLTVGGLYYFAAPWIVQGAVRFNESDPGSVRARQQLVAVTYGRDRAAQLVARYTWGRESYLAIGPASSLVDFRSREANILWRYRLDRSRGISVAAEHYRNPAYRRTGVMLGYFVELQ